MKRAALLLLDALGFLSVPAGVFLLLTSPSWFAGANAFVKGLFS